MSRLLKEAKKSLIEVGIAKCLSQAKLTEVELAELFKLTYADLITTHELDSIMAEKVRVHCLIERQRLTMQSLYTTEEPTERELFGQKTRTHPTVEYPLDI